MFCLKIVGKILLIPVWFILIIVGIIVKLVVNMVSIAKSFVVLGLVALVIGTIICYQDWMQVAFLDESENNNPSGELPPLDYLQSLPVEDINDFDKVIGKIINGIIVEACDLACWVYVCKFIEGLSLEQIVNQNRSAEQFIFALFSMFDKYIDIPDNDNNNIRPS